MKSAVGKDLTRVTMPVHFNEPVSFLQVILKVIQYGSEIKDIDTLSSS